jgi:hypothetical protein
MASEQGKEPDHDFAIRSGEFAMLIYSIGLSANYLLLLLLLIWRKVGVIAGTVLPHLAGRDRRLMGHKSDVDGDAELSRIRETVRQWRVDAARQGKPLRLPVMPFLLRNIWTGALLFFSRLMFSTFFITTVFEVGGRLSCEVMYQHPLLGDNMYHSCGYLLGSRDVGAFCNHNGGGAFLSSTLIMHQLLPHLASQGIACKPACLGCRTSCTYTQRFYPRQSLFYQCPSWQPRSQRTATSPSPPFC